MGEQRGGERVELGAVLAQQRERFVVGGVGEPADLAVDELAGLLRRRVGAPGTPAAAVCAEDVDEADRLSHASAADHLASEQRRLLQVGLGAAGDVLEYDLLGGAPREQAGQAAAQLRGGVAVAV